MFTFHYDKDIMGNVKVKNISEKSYYQLVTHRNKIQTLMSTSSLINSKSTQPTPLSYEVIVQMIEHSNGTEIKTKGPMTLQLTPATVVKRIYSLARSIKEGNLIKRNVEKLEYFRRIQHKYY